MSKIKALVDLHMALGTSQWALVSLNDAVDHMTCHAVGTFQEINDMPDPDTGDFWMRTSLTQYRDLEDVRKELYTSLDMTLAAQDILDDEDEAEVDMERIALDRAYATLF